MPVGPSLPYGYALFCDDVREEVGGKRSLMGIYTGEMMFPEPGPTTLPSLVVQINWICGRESFPKSLDFRIYRDTEESRETLFQAMIDAANLPPMPAPEPDKHDPDAPGVANFAFHARFGGLVFTEDCRLRVRGIVDGVEHRLGALVVKLGAQDTEN